MVNRILNNVCDAVTNCAAGVGVHGDLVWCRAKSEVDPVGVPCMDVGFVSLVAPSPQLFIVCVGIPTAAVAVATPICVVILCGGHDRKTEV